jgi:hypothetical protein
VKCSWVYTGKILYCEHSTCKLSSAAVATQGTRFTACSMAGKAFLLASHGQEVQAAELAIQSILVENALEAAEDTAASAAAAPPINRLLNYFHSTCDRFPVDDCIGTAGAKRSDSHSRTVRIHCCTGVHVTSVLRVCHVPGILFMHVSLCQHLLCHSAHPVPSGHGIGVQTHGVIGGDSQKK